MLKDKIISVYGKNIKKFNVEIYEDRIIVPVVPGHLCDIAPEFECKEGYSVSIPDGAKNFSNLTCTLSGNGEELSFTFIAVERGNSPLGEYGVFGDPGIIPLDGKFYIHPTTDGTNGWQSTLFHTFSSPDLLHWTDEGVILDFADIPWTGGVMAWAPSAIERNGKYYFYYSGGRYGWTETGRDGGRNIGVAVSDTPNGPFTDIGQPLIPAGTRRGQMIDPQVYIDDDGTPYLYWGNGGLYVSRLADDMISLEGEIYEITPKHFTEGVFVIKRDGKYYFTWSEGNTERADYTVRWGVSDSPTERPQGCEILISRENAEDPRIMCTGHHSILNVPGKDEWYVCYHRFNIPTTVEVGEGFYAGSHREPALDRLYFDENGNMVRVVPTLTGVTKPVHYGIYTTGNIARADGAIIADVTVANNNADGCVYLIFDVTSDGAPVYADKRQMYVDKFSSVSVKVTLPVPETAKNLRVKIMTVDEDGKEVSAALER